jgi:starch phosphorylase
MAQLTPRFSADRTVREYTEQHYLRAATAYSERAANKGALGKQMVDWRHAVDEKWQSLRFGNLRVETNADQHVFEVDVDRSAATTLESLHNVVAPQGPARR